VLKEPVDVAAQRRQQESAANAARLAAQRSKADDKAKMKGRNKPTRRQKKKQMNIIEDKKPVIRAKIQEEVSKQLGVAAACGTPTTRVLHAWWGALRCVRALCKGETGKQMFV
jgi:DNA invertase Pin-like site-specific DNA recombinase